VKTICLMGPTACGKSALALDLAAELGAEIVSVDSAQVFRGMNIGTAKPSAEERQRVPHHLIDLIDPDESYSAARFAEDARRAVAEIHARGRPAFLAGGTMLYFKALRVGLDALPGADPAIRARLDSEAAERGWPALHARLEKLDPPTAARLKSNDAQRIQRALEVIELSGQPFSSLIGAAAGGGFRAKWIALMPGDRAELHRRIADRFAAMLKAGFVEELRALKERYALRAELPSMRSVGYRQCWEFLEGRISARELEAKGIAATRQLAKRQITWLRSMANDLSLDPFASEVATKLRAAIAAN
jgi:tRNA dimethylallyltransferase